MHIISSRQIYQEKTKQRRQEKTGESLSKGLHSLDSRSSFQLSSMKHMTWKAKIPKLTLNMPENNNKRRPAVYPKPTWVIMLICSLTLFQPNSLLPEKHTSKLDYYCITTLWVIDLISQSACADETHQSFDCHFLQRFWIILVNSHSLERPSWLYMSKRKMFW